MNQESIPGAQPVVAPRKHSGCLTAFLALAVVANAAFAVITWAAMSKVSSEYQPFIFISGVLNLAGVAFAIAIYQWKRWGVYGYVACIGISMLLSLMLGDFLSAARGLIPLGLLAYLIRPSWSLME